MKFFLKAIILIVIFTVAWNYTKNKSSDEPLISLKDQLGNFSITIREPEKEKIKGIAKRISELVYHEATTYNPPGDIVPDQIDNNLIKEVKEQVN